MIVDAWAQHPTLRHARDPIFDSLQRWNREEPPTEELPVAATIRAMDAAGVAKALISAWVAPRNVMISNDEVAGFVGEHPDRLVGIGSVDISQPMRAVAEIRRCVEELGFKGIRVLPWLWELPPTDRLFYPVYAACCELGVPFCTQIGHTGPLMPSEVGRPIHLDRVALDFPELVIVAGHIGYPWTDEGGGGGHQACQRLHRHLGLDGQALSAAAGGLAPDQRRPQGDVRLQLPDDRAGEGARRPR